MKTAHRDAGIAVPQPLDKHRQRRSHNRTAAPPRSCRCTALQRRNTLRHHRPHRVPQPLRDVLQHPPHILPASPPASVARAAHREVADAGLPVLPRAAVDAPRDVLAVRVYKGGGVVRIGGAEPRWRREGPCVLQEALKVCVVQIGCPTNRQLI